MRKRKGIILAGGNGSRLYPLTYGTSKQLLPVYDKPMILYPIQTLLNCGVDEIAIVIKPEFCNSFHTLLKQINLHVKYHLILQYEPEGIAQAIHLTEEYFKGNPIVLVLGDNIFYSEMLNSDLEGMSPDRNVIFGYKVNNPVDYGVAVFNKSGDLVDVVEKPKVPPSKYAIPGLYFFDDTVFSRAKLCKKSDRGEYEITDVIKEYIKSGEMDFYPLPGEAAWFDCGTFNDLLDAGSFVRAIQKRTNNIIGYENVK